MPGTRHRKPAWHAFWRIYGNRAGVSQCVVLKSPCPKWRGREFPPPADPAPIPARHKKVWNRMGNTPGDVGMDGSSRPVLCRNSPVEMTDNRPSLENLPGDSRLDQHTSHEELISARRGQARDALCIRKADCLVGRRLRDLSLRPVLTHDPAPQVNCTPRTQNSTQEVRWRVFAPRVNHSRQIGI
jgi:hypothetical protein